METRSEAERSQIPHFALCRVCRPTIRSHCCGAGLGQAGLGSVIHSYPTVADAIGGCAFQYKMKHWETLEKK